MMQERWRRIEELYHAAFALPKAERAAMLAAACPEDEGLRCEVEALLKEPSDGGFLAAPAVVVPDPSNFDLDPGALLDRRLGPYHLRALLGSGGMGEVYRARDTTLERDVAIKILPRILSGQPDRLARFEREARILAALSHPNICAIHGLEESDGLRFLVLELIDGRTLAETLADTVGDPCGPGLPLKRALTIAAQIATAVEAAHARGIIHRDLKPANVLITPDRGAKVLDFGLAKAVSDQGSAQPRDPRNTSHTVAGVVLGTPAYMSPEQASGKPVDRRTDIWAFGVILFEMVAGARPFSGDNVNETLASVLKSEPDWNTIPATVPSDLRSLLERCLQKDPHRRLEWIGSARAQIEDLLSRGSKDSAASPRSRRSPRMAWTIGAALALGLAGAAAWSLKPLPLLVPSPEAIRLTFDDGLQTDPSLDPSGETVAYASDQSGNVDIWTRPLAGGNPVQVTSDPADDWQPDWSPDGAQIAYRSERGEGGIFVTPATGGVERLIAEFGYRPRWSPDGKSILFAQSIVAGFELGLHVDRRDGSPPRPLAGAQQALGGTGAFGWAPDSLEVMVLSSHAPFVLSVRTCSLSDGTVTEWAIDESVQRRFQLPQLRVAHGTTIAWRAPAGAIYFVGDLHGMRSVWSLDVDAAGRRVVGGPHRITTVPEAEAVSLSADARRLVLAGASRTSRLWAYSVDASNRSIGDRAVRLTSEAMHAVAPSLSLDGSHLLYVVEKPGGSQPSELVVRSMADGRERTVRATGERETLLFPRLNRDGTRVVFNLVTGNATVAVQQTRVLDLITGKETGLTSPIGPENMETPNGWSPDHRYIVTTGRRYRNGHTAIVLLPVAAAPHAEAAAQVVTSIPVGTISQPSMSPDGRWMAFRARALPGWSRFARIAVVSAAGGTAAQWTILTSDGASADKPRWSDDGQVLYFTSTNGDLTNAWGVGFDGVTGRASGAPFQLTSFSGPSAHILPDLGPMEMAVAGGRLVLPIVSPKGGLWTLQRPPGNPP